MSKVGSQRSGQPAADLLEEAVRLLRSAPPSILLMNYIGSVPCMLAVLYFLADLSGSADAESRAFPASIGLAMAYGWMKCWQAVFASRLRSVLLQEEPAPWTFRRLVNLIVAQVAIQSTGFILRPLATALTIPSVWTANFYQNVTVLADGDHQNLRELWKRAYTQCRLWPKQMHVAFVWLSVFRLFVWFNILAVMIAVPYLLKMFFGVETVFTKHMGGMLNPTFFAASFAATYLCMDPIRRAVTLLRCFRGGSLQSGADLELQLRTVRRAADRGTAILAALLLACAVLGPAPASAALKEEPKARASELNRSLDDILEKREFAWRAPREHKQATADGWLAQLQKDLEQWMERVTHDVGRWIGRIFKKIADWFDRKESSGSKGDWLSLLGSVRVLFYVLLGVAAIFLIVIVSRYRRRPRVETAQAEPIAPRPDLREENVTADQLPEEGWLQLARELMQSGELRLALRASYLASLAHLGHREFIRLAKHKSNRDYDTELRRRARTQPDLLAAFGRNLSSFERVWYGEHAVTTATLGDFTEQLEKIRAC
jgi:hypothetical protein